MLRLPHQTWLTSRGTVNLPALTLHGGLHDQLTGLGDRHDEPFDFRMRDSNRPAVSDLLTEEWHDAAGRTEHIAEAHGDIACVGVRVEVLAVYLRQPLSRPCSELSGKSLSLLEQ
jgi:hypothetical protein